MYKQNYLEVFINSRNNITIKTGDDVDQCIEIHVCDVESLISGLKMCQEELETQNED